MNKYYSPSTGEECTAAQLIAEIMVTREAAKKKLSLPYKFWNLIEWKKKYKNQILGANSLLKVYSAEAILRALKRKECSWQYSIRANGISDICDEEQRKLDKEKELINNSEKIITNNPSEFRQINTGQQSRKSKLD
jgi:hypothetical protein